jgi:DNA repair ATPase RecN
MQTLDIQYYFKLYPNIVCLHNGLLYQLEHCPGKRTKVFRKITYNEKRNAYYINGGLVTRKRLEKLKTKIHGKKNRQRS